ncbi:hypothetical protein PMZ80_004292 [Knufia obscura]|uniref:Uncharacterized protein n=2 Tax=Knufia TaxID=430999 RepID=A0AAN8EAE8_9EURO|nr:hypothetical protein PMZ80_004292 [Knufia obscura]KAK5949210.1 hypothetical protein OHC33_009751 [Knufia fluminis]
MPVAPGRSVRTAQQNTTIWSRISEDDFRKNLVALEELTNAVPVDVQVFPLADEGSDKLRLPLVVEQHIADDIAFLAAAQEGAQSVAAVCLEQHLKPECKLKIHVAAADLMDGRTRRFMMEVCNLLKRASKVGSHDGEPEGELFDRILEQHQFKILGRLRSEKWQKPRHLAASHKKPLWQDFDSVIHRVQHVYPKKKEMAQRKNVETRLRGLADWYEKFENFTDGSHVLYLHPLVRFTYEFCKNSDVRGFAARLDELRPTAQIGAALKCLRQLEKIGAYWRIAMDLIRYAVTYPHMFNAIELIYLPPYASIPTSIAYESWARTCHVHAEVQLVVEYDLQKAHSDEVNPETILPRIIGTSKYLCYLCYLFIKCHGRFVVPNTHGRLYDQWTVPDLAEYNDGTREHYAKILEEMNEIVCKQSGEELCWRIEPMTSRQNLLLGDLDAPGDGN